MRYVATVGLVTAVTFETFRSTSCSLCAPAKQRLCRGQLNQRNAPRENDSTEYTDGGMLRRPLAAQELGCREERVHSRTSDGRRVQCVPLYLQREFRAEYRMRANLSTRQFGRSRSTTPQDAMDAMRRRGVNFATISRMWTEGRRQDEQPGS